MRGTKAGEAGTRARPLRGRRRSLLGTMLVEEGLLTPEQLETAVEDQAARGGALGRHLVERGFLSEGDLTRALARQAGLPFADLAEYQIDAGAVALISSSAARRYQAVPVGWEGGRLVVAIADPSNVVALDDLRTLTGVEIEPIVATASQVLEVVQRFHRLDSEAGSVAQLAADEAIDTVDLRSVRDVDEDAPIVKFVSLLIAQAVQDRASDIHVEPGEEELRIRYRVDGVLHEVMRSPKSIQAGVTSRLKIMADLDIADRRTPQDGRMSVAVAGKTVELRVATLPTVHGEKVVMRVLDRSQGTLDLADLGFLPDALERYERSYRQPYGTVLVTGPTGSGKSTTLYATINALNDSARNIITVEDPVEYRLPGINQMQVHPKAGLTFASALRSILRADPDIILVGEIRDHETAVTAVQAALTGHLVLSTLHTNDASSTPMRLVEMGVEPFLVVSALDCVVAQRLARRLCERCRAPYEPSEAELAEVGWAGARVPTATTLYRPVGCSACARTGYRGRLAVHEVMVVTEEIERLVVDRAASDAVRSAAMEGGMLTLREDGMHKVAQGLTSLEEIFRVVA